MTRSPLSLLVKHTQLLQPVLIELVSQTVPQLHCPSLDVLQNVNIVYSAPRIVLMGTSPLDVYLDIFSFDHPSLLLKEVSRMPPALLSHQPINPEP